MKNSVKFPASKDVPQWKIDKWLVDIELSDMKNHVDAKKIEIACREALKNWPNGLEKNPTTIRSQSYNILTSRKVSQLIPRLDEVARHEITEKYQTDWRDR